MNDRNLPVDHITLTKQVSDLHRQVGRLTDSLGTAEDMLRQSGFLFDILYQGMEEELDGGDLLPAGMLERMMSICALGQREGYRWADFMKKEIHRIAEAEKAAAGVSA